MGLKFSKNIQKEVKKNKDFGISFRKKDLLNTLKESVRGVKGDSFNPAWNLVLLFVLFLSVFCFLIFHISKLQVVEGEVMLERSKNNQLRIREDKALRGVILDRNGNLLARNVSSMNVYLSVE
ncbi:MAG TPA: hypothetical protein PLG10_03110, partial [Candidatus Dojkabacteria bacterium]|nr:hypothetical protein [Candidatus Dojkabacteria bacterium]